MNKVTWVRLIPFSGDKWDAFKSPDLKHWKNLKNKKRFWQNFKDPKQIFLFDFKPWRGISRSLENLISLVLIFQHNGF